MGVQKKLSAFNKGERGTVISVEDDSLKVLLLGLGLGQGSVFTLSDIAPLGDPISIQTGFTKIAIRNSEAEKIIAEVSA